MLLVKLLVLKHFIIDCNSDSAKLLFIHQYLRIILGLVYRTSIIYIVKVNIYKTMCDCVLYVTNNMRNMTLSLSYHEF